MCICFPRGRAPQPLITHLIRRDTNQKRQKLEKKEETKLEQEMKHVPPCWAKNIKEVLFTEAQIQARVDEMALEISRDYEGEEVRICLNKSGQQRTLSPAF